FTHKNRPFARAGDLVDGDGVTATHWSEVVERTNRAHGDLLGPTADAEAGNDSGGEGIGERLRLGIDDVNCRAAQTIGQRAVREQVAKRTAVVDIEPFRRRDKSAAVARPGNFAGLEEEVDVQPGKLAGAEAEAARGGGEPGLPMVADVMVPDI